MKLKPQMHRPPILEISTPESNSYSSTELFFISLRFFEVAYISMLAARIIDHFLDNWQANKHIKGVLGLLTVAPLSVISLLTGFAGLISFCLIFDDKEVERVT